MAIPVSDTISHKMHRLWDKCKTYLQHLNLFPSMESITDAHQFRNEIISTRIFLVLFILSLAILLLYTSVVKITKTVRVPAPSYEEYARLNSSYSQTLSCPCQNISIDYRDILHVNYTLHQTISDSLNRFYSNQFVTASVILYDVFQSQVQALIDQFQLSIINDFSSSLTMVRETTQGNALLSNFLVGYTIRIDRFTSSLAIHLARFDDDCICPTSSTCVRQSSIYTYPVSMPLFKVPNFYIGCYVIESLLQSTLQCFYDQNCIDTVISYVTYSPPIAVTALNSSLPSNYLINTTFNDILQNLMIEQWNSSVNHEDYYKQCHPAECTYIYETRNDLLYIITTLIGLIGGLSTGLRILVPFVVKLIRRKKRQQNTFNVLTTRERVNILYEKLKYSLQNFNLFPSIPPSTDQYKLCNQIISTRIFLVLFILSLAILLLYTSVVKITKRVHVPVPSYEEYARLNSSYSQTLSCPCKQISISYKAILDVNYTFHQICTSIFVSEEWINTIPKADPTSINPNDFRMNFIYRFRALSDFCTLSNQTISNALNQFYSSQYIRSSVTSYKVLELQIQALITEFKLFTINDFLSSISMIRETTQSNSLTSGTLSSHDFFTGPSGSSVSTAQRTYNNCSCAHSAQCTESTYIWDNSTDLPSLLIPGFDVGCYTVEALLKSTLECLYDQNCIDTIQLYMSDKRPSNITFLNISLSSNYRINSTVNDLLKNLMIEQWNINTMYEIYYEQCQPVECVYSYETQNAPIYIITTLIGLVGGLATVLKLTVPLTVELVAYCIRKWKTRRVNPNSRNEAQ
ncbi:unnamed protein product [Adineta ricciae]|uniref:Uncharacterized protein n=1 Tax=Adineta ricciae TaxID=249248 RepID=A0A815WQJ4_ADIRI|nr:unnamed protein product [Adineta ricciae]CAF1552230.1 unnamed protein product [Adineta ricciae]